MIKAFCDSKWQVFAAMRASSDGWRLKKLLPAQPAHLKRTELDLSDSFTVRRCLHEIRPNVVVHCAAYGVDYRQQDLEEAIVINVIGTAQLVIAAKEAGVERFLHVGTCYEYGETTVPIREDAPLRPKGIYGSTKAAGTIIALERAHAMGLPLAVVRPFGMYGPLEGPHKLIPQILRACLTRTPIELTSGHQVRDYVYVEDVTQACLLLAAIKVYPSGEIFNIGSGQPLSIRALGEALARVVGNGQGNLNWSASDLRPNEIMQITPDLLKTATILGWQSQTSLEDGLRVTLEFERFLMGD
jgi:nucleoside-diphosphate-sugar epimerase